MATVADQFNTELVGAGSLADREYARLKTLTGVSTGSLRDLYRIAGETPRLPLGKYIAVGGGPPNLGYGNNAYGTYPYGD